MNTTHHYVAKDFGAKTLRALTRNGVTITGSQLLPGAGDMPWTNATRGYVVDDNGQGRVFTYADVMKRAA